MTQGGDLLKKLIFIVALVATAAFAGEGMWMPQQVPALAPQLQQMGLKLDPSKLADLTGDPLGAVISLGGCTASFVSPDGLIVTNHHCAFGSIQYNSTPQRDLITNGFIARTREEELPAAPGTKVWVTTRIEDATDGVTGKLAAKLADADREKTIERRIKGLVAACEKPGGVRCRVAPFFEGSQYLMTTQAELSEIKLVYAPARAIGEFGGEVDNFEWPRHTGDWSLYRAYQNGQPYHPQHWLKVSAAGVNPGDFVMVAGYPGRTFRYRTADEVRNYRDFIYPTGIRYYTDVMKILEDAGKNDKAVELKNTSRIKSFANSLKNYTSVNEGFTKDKIFEARLAREEKLRAAGAGPLLDEIAGRNGDHIATQQRDTILTWLIGAGSLPRGSVMLHQAAQIVRSAQERPKPDAERATGYQQRDVDTIRLGSDRAQRVMDPATDRAVVRYFLVEASKLPQSQRLEAVDRAVAAGGGIDAFLDRLYGGTKVGDQAERTKMLTESSQQLEARHDSLLDFATSLVALAKANEQRDLAYQGAMSRIRPQYMDALRKLSGGNLYPDANLTLRLTFGKVEGYVPKDATVYTPQTTLGGVLQKETGQEPFASPKALLAAAKDPAKTTPWFDPQLHDVPVNFLSTCDTTGGNSGSPTMNANGELIGLLFDGNYESIDADFLFNPAVTRSIHVDINYMFWVLDAVDGGQNILRELGVQPRVR
ncbi:MAG TPA: S46 family peptidase [Thermoanaerobaculia bacterium]|nr:S46 family peptidase [Thermoanaerobaculia bacterium]